MDSGFYAATTGLISKTAALDLIANNMANAGTAGYKAEVATFRGVLAESTSGGTGAGLHLSQLNRSINGFGTLQGSRLDFSQGGFEPTSNPLDAAIDGSAFFAVQGSAGERYTRAGSFHVSSAGTLVAQDGRPVLGDQGPITLPPGIPSISGDGTISVNGVVAGRLKLVEFPAGTDFVPEGATYYRPPSGTHPLPGTAASIRGGGLESSNVNPVAAIVQLIETQRSAEMLSHAMAMFDTQFDRTATTDLPKI